MFNELEATGSIEVLVTDTKQFNCPLLNRSIDVSECYDIQAVRTHLLKSECATTFNALTADTLCENCSFNQLY